MISTYRLAAISLAVLAAASPLALKRAAKTPWVKPSSVASAVLPPDGPACADSSKVLCEIAPPNVVNQALPNVITQSELNRFGLDVLNGLIGSGSADTDTPQWEDWQTKCDALSETTLCDTSPRNALLVKTTPSRKFLFSLQAPIQRNLIHARAAAPNGQGLPQLASVLYNPIAAEDLQDGRADFSTNSVTPAMKQLRGGAIIVKTVWTIISADSPKMRLYASTLTPDREKQWGPTDPNKLLPPILDVHNTFFQPVILGTTCSWGTNLSLPPSTAAEDCIHLYRNIRRLPAANEPPRGASVRCKPSCAAALVGVQLMVRVHDNDDWIWIAMWWTGRDQGIFTAGPWKYYAMDVTNTPRAILPDNTVNIVSNPFLEGSSDVNGAVANCVNCHSYAAFDRTTKAAKSEGFSQSRGAPPLPSATNPQAAVPPLARPTLGSPIVNNYLLQAEQTDFVWSAASKPQPQQSPRNQQPKRRTSSLSRRRKVS